MLAKVPETLPFLSRMEAPLLALSPRDEWRIRDSYEGVWISGATGSGKTSGSGKALAHSFLKAGYGGLVLCAMPSERFLWERYAAECGRTNSVIVFDGSGDLRINFLNYELARHADNMPVTFNVVRMLSHILDVAEGKAGQQTTENPFWRTSMQQLLTNCIAPLWAARGEVTLAGIMRMIATRPKTEKQRESRSWWDKSDWGKIFIDAWDNAKHPYPDEDYNAALDWWQHTFLSDDPSLALWVYAIPYFLLATYLGPTFSIVQTLVGSSIRATASSVLLFVISLIGIGLGPQFVGIASDVLGASSALGDHGLRWALVITLVFNVLCTVLYMLAAATVRDDLDLKHTEPVGGVRSTSR